MSWASRNPFSAKAKSAATTAAQSWRVRPGIHVESMWRPRLTPVVLTLSVSHCTRIFPSGSWFARLRSSAEFGAKLCHNAEASTVPGNAIPKACWLLRSTGCSSKSLKFYDLHLFTMTSTGSCMSCSLLDALCLSYDSL